MFKANSLLEAQRVRRSSRLVGTRLTLAVLGTSHLVIGVLFFFAPA